MGIKIYQKKVRGDREWGNYFIGGQRSLNKHYIVISNKEYDLIDPGVKMHRIIKELVNIVN